MKVVDIVDRCSQFSGYNLGFRIEGDKITIEDPDAVGKSTLTLKLASFKVPILHEVYGRMRHWGITAEEIEVLWEALKENSK